MNRRQFLVATAATTLAAKPLFAQSSSATTTTAPATTRSTADYVWHDVRDVGVEGRAFDDTLAYFDRLPGRAKGIVRDAVWNLSRQTAGMRVYFETDAVEIGVRYRLTSPNLAMPHMAATGVSGVDLYARLDGTWRWVATHQPKSQDNDATIVNEWPAGRRTYVMHLPLYNGVTSFEVGVPRGATFAQTPPRKDRSIVWYGTSILQGACASRPGMAFTNILCRRLDRPIHNFGFSGNGTTEVEVGRFLAEIDAGAFVIDTMPNTAPQYVRPRIADLLKLFRAARPKTPIVVMEDRTWGSGPLASAAMQSLQRSRRAELRAGVDDARQAGVEGVTYVPDAPFLGDDGEATVDGSHPTDLGMVRYADAMEPVLRKVL